jgi:hypothetical protein
MRRIATVAVLFALIAVPLLAADAPATPAAACCLKSAGAPKCPHAKTAAPTES